MDKLMRTYVISSILVIVALASIALQEHLKSINKDDWRLPYLSELSSAFLVSGVLSILFHAFESREADRKLRKLLRIHDSVDELGLEEIATGSHDFNYSHHLKEAESVAKVMNIGLRWIGNNVVALQNRFSKPGQRTEIFTLDPESDFLATLARKHGRATGEMKTKINEAWARLIETYNQSEKKGSLTIYKIAAFPTKSLFVTESVLIETPYPASSGRTNVAITVFRNVPRPDAPYWCAMRDVEKLRDPALVHFKSEDSRPSQ